MTEPSLLFAFVLGVTLVEGLALVLWHRLSGRGLRPVDVLCQLAAGVLLLVAALLALHGAGLAAIGTALAAAGGAHLIDLLRRLR